MRYNSRFTDDENIENFGKSSDIATLTKDIADTIRAIAIQHPTKKHILFGMFGNPDESSFCLPSKVKISKVARDIGVKYIEAYTFYKQTIQQTFKERFAVKMEA